MKQYKYNYFYRIENLIDGKFYYGIHSTDNIEDGYMGSGHRLVEAMKIFGKNNFKKEILKNFETREKASEYEALMVTENLVHDRNCYNVKCGGDYGTTSGTILVKDKNEKWSRVSVEDERYKSGELRNIMASLVSVYDKEDNSYKTITPEEFHSNGDRYIGVTKGKVVVKDDKGEILLVDVEDERYKSGELTVVWKGKKHSEETKIKISETHKRNHHQQGVSNSQYGTCWITKNGENKKVKKEDLNMFVSDGWKNGRSNLNVTAPSDLIDKNKVISLYKKYNNWGKVAEELGVSRMTIMRYKKRNL